MSAVIVAVTDRRPLEPLPALVRQKIAAFCAAGHTGQIVLDVKEGKVLAYKLTEAGRVAAAELDSKRPVTDDSGN